MKLIVLPVLAMTTAAATPDSRTIPTKASDLLKTVSKAEPVDLLLCLAADVSESVTKSEYDLQRKGHASAIQDPQVVQLIKNGLHGRVAVAYLEWANQEQQYLGVDWHIISDDQSARAFAKKIENSAKPPWITARVRNTSTSEAIRYCLRKFRSAPVTATRRVIDISSDGTHNIGAKIQSVRDEALAENVTINVLAIVNSNNPFPEGTHTKPKGGLANYFKANVMGGAGSFVQVAEDYTSVGQMLKRKFLLELAALPPPE